MRQRPPLAVLRLAFPLNRIRTMEKNDRKIPNAVALCTAANNTGSNKTKQEKKTGQKLQQQQRFEAIARLYMGFVWHSERFLPIFCISAQINYERIKHTRALTQRYAGISEAPLAVNADRYAHTHTFAPTLCVTASGKSTSIHPANGAPCGATTTTTANDAVSMCVSPDGDQV